VYTVQWYRRKSDYQQYQADQVKGAFEPVPASAWSRKEKKAATQIEIPESTVVYVLGEKGMHKNGKFTKSVVHTIRSRLRNATLMAENAITECHICSLEEDEDTVACRTDGCNRRFHPTCARLHPRLCHQRCCPTNISPEDGDE